MTFGLTHEPIFSYHSCMVEQTQTPILFCNFNRPQLTEQVLERIRIARPKTLLLASDGPRGSHPEDLAKVESTRRILGNIDWPCTVHTRFSERNLGCKKAMSSAISWAFELSEELIILEDDCLPDPSFFSFCDLLLKRYRDHEEVMMVSGNNFQKNQRGDASYYFSRWTHIWGWATWKRAWQHFDVEVSSWPEVKRSALLRRRFSDSSEYAHWSRTLDLQHAGQIDTWDFPWAYSVWRHGGMSVLPQRNLVTNIGFGSEATHTTDPESKLAGIPACNIGDIIHPKTVEINHAADHFTWETIFKPAVLQSKSVPTSQSRGGKLRRWLRKRVGAA